MYLHRNKSRVMERRGCSCVSTHEMIIYFVNFFSLVHYIFTLYYCCRFTIERDCNNKFSLAGKNWVSRRKKLRTKSRSFFEKKQKKLQTCSTLQRLQYHFLKHSFRKNNFMFLRKTEQLIFRKRVKEFGSKH